MKIMTRQAMYNPFGKCGELIKDYGIELSPRYFSDSCYYLESAEKEMMTPDLFGFLPAVNG